MGIAVGFGSKRTLGSGGKSSIIIEDSLTSTSTTNALSANLGKVLDDKITNLLSRIEIIEKLVSVGTDSEGNTTEAIDTVQELYNYVSSLKNTDTITNTIINESEITATDSDDTDTYGDVF